MTVPVEASSSCAYECDSEFRVVSVDPAWSEFAVANGAPELVSPGPLGRSLWSYIADPTTAYVFRQLFDKVMATGRSASVPIRCDSPTMRRYLNLTIDRRTGGGVRMTSTVVRLEPRPSVALLEPDRPRDAGMLKMCSWCKRAQLEGEWVEVEELTTALRLFERDTLPQITHGMCDECHAAIAAMIDDDR